MSYASGPPQPLEIVPKALARTAVHPAAGGHAVRCGPDDLCAAGFQGQHQLHIFMRRQWLEAAHALVGLGAYAEVGAMDMPMPFTGLITAAVQLA